MAVAVRWRHRRRPYGPQTHADSRPRVTRVLGRAAAERAKLKLSALAEAAAAELPAPRQVQALEAAVRDLHVKRPFFHPPRVPRAGVARAAVAVVRPLPPLGFRS